MSFSSIIYKYNGNEEAKLLTDLVEQKLSSLNRFIGNNKTVCEVEFKTVTHHHSGAIFSFEVNLTVDGKLYRSAATEVSFEKAIDEVRNELDSELSRSKDKNLTTDRRARRMFKASMLN